MLLKLGSDLGLEVWAARNDRNRSSHGKSFTDLPRIRKDLPRQFDEATTRTIELIDVLWLRGHAIEAAFEIESTTVIYSGLLRMADLLAMQPNLNIPLFVAASDERRDKVMVEVNRPTFSRLSPPSRTLVGSSRSRPCVSVFLNSPLRSVPQAECAPGTLRVLRHRTALKPRAAVGTALVFRRNLRYVDADT